MTSKLAHVTFASFFVSRFLFLFAEFADLEAPATILIEIVMTTEYSNQVVAVWNRVAKWLVPVVFLRGMLTVAQSVAILMAAPKAEPAVSVTATVFTLDSSNIATMGALEMDWFVKVVHKVAPCTPVSRTISTPKVVKAVLFAVSVKAIPIPQTILAVLRASTRKFKIFLPVICPCRP